MPEWRVPINWEMQAILHIEADTLEEAIDKAYSVDIPIPDDGEYMDDSWHVPDIDVEEIRDWYNDGRQDEPAPENDARSEEARHGLRAYVLPPDASISFIEEEDQKEYEEANPDEMFGFLFLKEGEE